MSQTFLSINGRPAWYCQGCKGFHCLPRVAEISGTDIKPTISMPGSQLGTFIEWDLGCIAAVKNGVVYYDNSCRHELHGTQAAIAPLPTVAVAPAGVNSYSVMAA